MAKDKDKEKEAAKTTEAAAAAPAAAGPPKKSHIKMIAIAAAVVLLEGGTVVGTMMLNGGPRRATAEVPVVATVKEVEKDVEVPIIDAKLPNSQSGRLFLYDIQVVAKVSDKKKEQVVGLLAERAAEVKDKIRTIVASSEPKALSEPGLETLRRQIAYQLEQNLGKELIKELLVPKCTPFRAEF